MKSLALSIALAACCGWAAGEPPCTSAGESDFPLVSARVRRATSPYDWRSIAAQQAVSKADPVAREFITELGIRLVSASPAPEDQGTVFIVYDDDYQLTLPWYGTLVRDSTAFPSMVRVLPGGLMLVPISLLEVTPAESEFAAALARGIGHVLLNHFSRFTSRFGPRVVPIPPAGKSPAWSPFGETHVYPKSLEIEADCAAATILANAHINPGALLRHIRNSRASFDSSENRVKEVTAVITSLPVREYDPEDNAAYSRLRECLSQRPHPRTRKPE